VSRFLNLSAYRFVTLNDLADLRESVRSHAQQAGLKGTVLLAEEGINFCLAGPPAGLDAFMAWLDADSRFAGLTAKRSWSDQPPFGRLLVKVKREIIRMNRPAIRPEAQRAPSVDPLTLARWLDRGHDDDGVPVVMLDTRNAFEVDHGGFDGAIDWRLAKFSDFPAALEQHHTALQGKTVVSYCTGGIRCEKAALLMQEQGIERGLQLEGGILAYFEATGGRHYRGGCFVFDERVALDSSLSPAESAVLLPTPS
jgi:UPF0176 protein